MGETKEFTPRQFLDYIKSFKRATVKYDINEYCTMLINCKTSKARMLSSATKVQYLYIDDWRKDSSFHFSLGGEKFFIKNEKNVGTAWVEASVTTDCSDTVFEFGFMK